MRVTLELRLLLLALALRGEAVSPPVSPPVSPSVSPAPSPPEPPSESCGAALADVLRRLRELEGHVRALRGHCGDTGGPQAGTGRSVQLCAPPAGGGCACPAPSGQAPPPAPPPPPCPRGCSDQGRCERGRCRCFPGFSGPDCATAACAPGWGGARCDIEVPWVTPRLASRTPTSLRITWPQPLVPPDGYRVTLVPLDDPVAMTTHELPSSAVAFSVTGLSPGRPFELLVQARRGPHLGAPGVLRLRTALVPPVPHYEGSPASPQGSLGSPAVAPSARGPPESLGSPGSPVSPLSPDLSLGSPASPKVPASPVARGSLGSPAPSRSSVSPGSPESPAPPESPGSSVSPDFSVPPVSPESPVFAGSTPPPWSPVSPLSPGSVPSLQDLVARLSTYSGSLLQRLESHLRATNYPLRGNQTVPGVARAILGYILRRHPALGRGQGPTGESGNQEPVPEWGDMDGVKLTEPWRDVGKTAEEEQEELPLRSEEQKHEKLQTETPPSGAAPAQAALGELRVSSVSPDSVQLQWSVPRGSFDSFTLQYRDAQGQPQALPIDGGSRSVTVPGLSPSRRYRFHLYGLRAGKRTDHVSTEATTGAPGTLWVGSVWPRSARLHWDSPQTPPDGYELQYGPPGGAQQTLWLPPEARSQQLRGLEPAGRYGVRLWGRGGDPQSAPLEATFDTPPLPHPHPRDCAEEQLNGPGPSRETLIFLRGDPARPLRVFCDMDTDGGGWLVFQRRQDGGTDFWRGWDAYARGFGNVSGEFWLGNEALHELTAAARTELRVDLRTARDSAFATYRDFAVGSAAERYRLRVGAFSGTAGDALSYHSGSPFSTRDRDPRDPRDRRDPSGRPRPPPCAVAYGGAWWYRNCHYANLNGLYGTPRDHQGIHWFPWKGFNVSIPFTEMKLRPQRG